MTTFGAVFIIALIVSTVYAVARTIYERRRPPADDGPDVIPFSKAVRLSHKVATDLVAAEDRTWQERVAAERGTPYVIKARTPHGSLAADVPLGDAGEITVDIARRLDQGRHRRADGGLPGVA